MMETIIESAGAQNGSTSSESVGLSVNISDDIFAAFDERLEELVWKENDDGRFFAGDDEFSPETVARFALRGGEIQAELVDVTRSEWQQFSMVSRPATDTSPQFD